MPERARVSEIHYDPNNDYYVLFDLPPNAGADDIARAHKRLAKACHPDLHPDKEWATERFKEINRAYAVLRDPVSKGEYDRVRWVSVGRGATQERARQAGPVKPPPSQPGDLDAERHRRDKKMSHFILGIEVVVMTFFLLLVLYRAITKHKF